MNIKGNMKELTSKGTIDVAWQSALGSLAYVGVPALINKFFDNRPMDGILGLVTGLASAIALFLFTGWKGALYAGITHTEGQLIWYGMNQVDGFEPFNAFPTSMNDSVNDWTGGISLPPAEFSHSAIGDGVDAKNSVYQEFYN